MLFSSKSCIPLKFTSFLRLLITSIIKKSTSTLPKKLKKGYFCQ